MCLYPVHLAMKDTNGLYKDKYRINSARRSDYDYSQAGGYFITICTKNREYSFGNIQLANPSCDIAGVYKKVCSA